MNRNQVLVVALASLGFSFFSDSTASPASNENDEAYEACVLSMMYGQTPYMLPMAQDFCRSLPVVTKLTQDVKFNLCKQTELCITDKPSDYIITRVVGYFTTRSPCVIDIYQDKKVEVANDYLRNKELLLVREGSVGWTSDTYYLSLVNIPYNCYHIEIYGYKHCVSGFWSGLKCTP